MSFKFYAYQTVHFAVDLPMFELQSICVSYLYTIERELEEYREVTQQEHSLLFRSNLQEKYKNKTKQTKENCDRIQFQRNKELQNNNNNNNSINDELMILEKREREEEDREKLTNG